MIKPNLENYPISIIRENEGREEVLLDITYRRRAHNNQERAEIILYTRGGKRSRNRYFVNNFLPYIYVDCNESELSQIIHKNQMLSTWIVSTEQVQKTMYNGGKKIDLFKIYGRQPWLVPSIRSIFSQQDIKYYEADIPFTHRFMIDMDLVGLQGIRLGENLSKVSIKSLDNIEFNPRVTSIDIEIDSSISKDEGNISFKTLIEEANRRITALGFCWNRDDGSEDYKLFLLDKDEDNAEREMISQIFEFLWKDIDPDVIITYNGDNFDFPYLIKRMEILNLPATLLSPYGDQEPIPPGYGNGWKIPGVLVFDLYKRTRWMYTADGRKTLGSIANELLKISKVEILTDHGKLWKNSLTSEDQKSMLQEYLKRDVELTYRLWNAMNMPEWLEVIKISGGPPGDGMYFTERQTGEFLVFHTMFQNNILIPPAPTPDQRKQRKKDRVSAKGGLVLDPSRDLSNAVIICDFTSMYPSIIVAHNVGAESFKSMKGDPKFRFRDFSKTSMAIMQEQILNKRIKVKEQLQDTTLNEKTRKKLLGYNWAIKLVANSTYGGYNYIGSRFYNTALAQTITAIGRNYLLQLSEKVKEFGPGYETIYGDTDSVFIESPLNDKIEQLWNLTKENSLNIEKLLPEVGELLKFLTNMLPEQMRLELQDIAYRIIFHKGAKKRYAYVSAITKNINILGFEAIRHDWSPFAKNVQKKAFDMILHTGDLIKTKKEIISYIQSEIAVTGESLKKLVTTFGPVKKKPQKYKSKTPAVSAFLHYNKTKNLDHEKESRRIDYFPFIVTSGSGPLKNRSRHPDFVDWKDVDLDYYIDEALRTINRFNLNITLNEIKGIKYKRLIDFFQEETK